MYLSTMYTFAVQSNCTVLHVLVLVRSLFIIIH